MAFEPEKFSGLSRNRPLESKALSYQHVWYQIFVFHFPIDVTTQFLENLNFSFVRLTYPISLSINTPTGTWNNILVNK